MGDNTKRRDFLKYLGVGSVALTTAGFALAEDGKSEVKEAKKPHYGMIFDQNKCVGCAECETACQKTNFVPKDQMRLFVQDKTDPSNLKDRTFTRVSCQQCEDAPCVAVCPSNACHIDGVTNIVTMNADDCIGCKYCIVACPYDVRFINEETGAAENCNFCLDTNFAEGEEPACVQSCKYDALIFGDYNDESSYINRVLSVKNSVRMKPGFGTKPSLRYIPKRDIGV